MAHSTYLQPYIRLQLHFFIIDYWSINCCFLPLSLRSLESWGIFLISCIVFCNNGAIYNVAKFISFLGQQTADFYVTFLLVFKKVGIIWKDLVTAMLQIHPKLTKMMYALISLSRQHQRNSRLFWIPVKRPYAKIYLQRLKS